MVEPLRHRQTKGAATDMFYLMPPRHISTLHQPDLPPLVPHVRCQGMNGPIPEASQCLSLTQTGSWAPLRQMRCHSSKPAPPSVYILYTSGLFFGCAKMPSCEWRTP